MSCDFFRLSVVLLEFPMPSSIYLPHSKCLGNIHGNCIINKNIIMSSFKSSRDIQKKEGGPMLNFFPFHRLFLVRVSLSVYKIQINKGYSG